MEAFYPILIDIGVLALILLLYYLIQRYRIIRNDKFEIRDIIEELAEQIHQFSEDNPEHPHRKKLETYADHIRELFETSRFEELAREMKTPPAELPSEMRYDSDHLYEKIMFHAKK
ncbi:MAG: hypothetical protein CME62_09250 [Halobacteriovoraceae bacterium]|nr:hypothetical protein [Halobacteriovoraceae bacterium]|tara:strand:- start:6588 stop:6935 length:348 start_codon:yes stop_codon:yes gene_type:complete